MALDQVKLRGCMSPTQIATFLDGSVIPMRLAVQDSTGSPWVVSLWFLYENGRCGAQPIARRNWCLSCKHNRGADLKSPVTCRRTGAFAGKVRPLYTPTGAAKCLIACCSDMAFRRPANCRNPCWPRSIRNWQSASHPAGSAVGISPNAWSTPWSVNKQAYR